MHENGRFVMVGNECRAPRDSVRSRFTFAHELGHYFLEDHRAALISGMWATRSLHRGSRGSLFEHEADIFAANLLMPEERFREVEAALSGTAFDHIVGLAEVFGTSLTSTAYRALELDLFPAPAAVFLWNWLGEPAGRRVSPETLWLGQDYCELTGMPPDGTLTARAIQDLKFGEQQGISQLISWFTGLHCYDGRYNACLIEEVKSLGTHGWMTLVYGQQE
ncbi:MAG: ImmA/IrrE family metallo-endopeptidase [Opitutaceae bacterium]|nr:ImmA/IrrE family metallo-endopeptidase [Opitutaceae bacterium]